MHRFALLAAAAVLILPATASAAPYGELAPLPAGGAATCLRATGAPGELVRSSPTGARLMTVTAAGIADAGVVPTGVSADECPQVAARPGGAGVVAQSGSVLWVATRDPGGAWGAPVRLGERASRAAVAVADDGAAVVAWLEADSGGGFTVKAARRPAGGGFAAAVALGTGSSGRGFSQQASIRAAMGAGGDAIVLWTQPPIDPATSRVPVQAAIAPAGGAFGPAQRLGETVATSAPALAAAPDGRALAAFWDGRAVQVAERAPGTGFAGARRVASAEDPYAVTPAVAIGSGGAAVLGWEGLLRQEVRAVSRAGAGAFGAPVTIAAPTAVPGLSEELLTLIRMFGLASFGPLGAAGLAPDRDAGNLRAALTADGRALLTLQGAGGSIGPRVATFPLAGGHLDRVPLGARVRATSSVAPLLLGDGTAAAAWTDNRGEADGRVHVALEGRPIAVAPAAPRVELGRPRKLVLKARDPLALPVRCDAACDVRVDLPDYAGQAEYVSLPGAGSRVVEFAPEPGSFLPARRGPVRVRLRVSAPAAEPAAERIETVTVRRLPGKPIPRVRHLKAVRRGSAVVVSWSTDIGASADSFVVLGSPRQKLGIEGPANAGEPRRVASRRFTARIPKAGKVRYVRVLALSEDTLGRFTLARVR